MKNLGERAQHIGKYAPRHLTVVGPEEERTPGHIANKARRERETNHPRYRALIEAAIENAKGCK